MAKKLSILASMIIFLLIIAPISHAQSPENPSGQIIQINTRFQSFVGKPQWLLIIRDVDNNQNIPYLFEVKKGNHYWVAFTYGRNYLITVSNLQFSPYRTNPYRSKVINNFCNLESKGRIIRGESLSITINGDLSPNTNTFRCDILRYTDANFKSIMPGAD